MGKPVPPPPSEAEKRIYALEKKYMTGDFAPGMQIGACKMEGGAVGHFVKGECVAYTKEETNPTPSKQEAAEIKALEGGASPKEVAAAADGGDSAAGGGMDAQAEAAAGSRAGCDGGGKGSRKEVGVGFEGD